MTAERFEAIKAPAEELDYQVDWTDWLDGDTIAVSTWTVPEDLTQPVSATNSTTAATVWLAGGELGRSYRVVNQIETAGGRTAERTIAVKMARK